MNGQQKKYRLGTVSKKIYPVSRRQPRHWFLKTDLMTKATKKFLKIQHKIVGPFNSNKCLKSDYITYKKQ